MPARHLLRYLSDDEVGGIAKTGGVIGIGHFKGAICSLDPMDVVKAIAHVRDVPHRLFGLGSDFDGATTVGFDASQMVAVTQALLAAGFSEERDPQGHGRQRAARAPRGDRAGLKSRAVIPAQTALPFFAVQVHRLGLERCTAPLLPPGQSPLRLAFASASG
jgi:hypothetical protein